MVNEEFIWKILEEVKDPEIPVISIVDLGIVNEINILKDKVNITIIPTYTSCPAMDLIRNEIIEKISKYIEVIVSIKLNPIWTTDLISEKGKKLLKDYGITPPNSKHDAKVSCPRCNSFETEIISLFGSTACKSLYKCNECLEPFDYFKCHK